ncbi:MAG: SRPBCC domain-containing protein [Acidimicrobiia bacterium]|nr:SRPBCC domain-containing protein [Acidimicrobiia bacterium]
MSSRKHDFSIAIDAPIELVWKAISEGEEITKWFAPDARVTPGEGGSLWLSWGPGMEGESKISIWEPGHRFQTLEGPAESPKTVDYILESKGGKTILRLVHSGFGAEANFDDEYEATYGGWLTFLAMLKHGLENHAGQPARNVTAFQFIAGKKAEAWKRLTEAIELQPPAAELTEQSRYRATLQGEVLTGIVVRYPKPGYLCLEVEGSRPGLLSLFVENCGGQCGVTVTRVVFGANAQAPDITGFLQSQFPAAGANA